MVVIGIQQSNLNRIKNSVLLTSDCYTFTESEVDPIKILFYKLPKCRYLAVSGDKKMLKRLVIFESLSNITYTYRLIIIQIFEKLFHFEKHFFRK